GVQQGGASFQVLPELDAELKKTGGKLGNVVQFGAFSEAYQDLVNRRVDAVIHNIVSLSTLVSEKPDVFELGQRVGRKSYAAWPSRPACRSGCSSRSPGSAGASSGGCPPPIPASCGPRRWSPSPC